MSMETLRRMQSYYRDLDRMEDQCYRKRTADRKVVLSEADTQAQGEELYQKVVRKVRQEIKGNLQLHERSVRCKTRPNCVFDYVVKKLESKGWKAKHVSNDNEIVYDDNDRLVNMDTVKVTPPDVITDLLKSLD